MNMDRNRAAWIVGVTVLIVAVLVGAVSAAVWGNVGCSWNRWRHTGMSKANFTAALGLPEKATSEQAGDVMWEKHITSLGLTEKSTLVEYRQALKKRMQSDTGEGRQKRMAKLNMSANSSKEGIMNAMRQQRNGGEELLQDGMARHGLEGRIRPCPIMADCGPHVCHGVTGLNRHRGFPNTVDEIKTL